ncbi:hypothetical protein FHS23_002295 [Prauserella isguenensis]|uniref:Uncharacterized protein n=1 Tax=Prauserella isguenensis TaxID=1470180 RepID=A0A839S1L0_9PSEU|nr:hypothetical protein [Prauserella isguenensis]
MRYSARCTGRALAVPSGHEVRAGAPRGTGPEIVVAESEPERESRT